MPPSFPPILISVIRKTEADDYYMEFDMSDEFVAWFKKEQKLKRWSNKRFEKWVTENIDAIVEQQPQLTAETKDDEERD